MARGDESILNRLIKLPWWMSVPVSVAVYTLLKYIVPSIRFGHDFSGDFLKGLQEAGQDWRLS